jgi:Uma2 family endonuclease
MGCNLPIVEPMNAPRSITRNPLVEAAIDYASRLQLDGRWETNGHGQIIVHQPIGLLHAKRGVKAPDRVVASPTFDESTDERGFLLYAPELCIEMMSPSNSWEEMRHKTLLYLAAGAKEAWICDNEGAMHYFDGAGTRAESALAPGMLRVTD